MLLLDSQFTVFQHEISQDDSNGPPPQINITNVVRILQKPGVLNVMAKKNGGVVPFLMIIAVLNVGLILFQFLG